MGDVITSFSEVKNEEDPVPRVREDRSHTHRLPLCVIDAHSAESSRTVNGDVMVCSGSDGRCARFVERRQSALNFALLVVGYILYLLVGAGIFSAIERPYEQELRSELKAARRDFLSNNSCVSDARLEELLARALEASNYGVTVVGNKSERNWDFVSSLFFTSTVLTTTGYGHSVPLSDEGKGFCMFYALFGIPITLFLLTVVVQRIMVLVTRRPLAYFHHRWAWAKSKLAAVHATCLTIIMTLLLLLIPAWIFVSLEKEWDFMESVYFCFISLTTIGLGDYVPGENQSGEDLPHPDLYRLAITGESESRADWRRNPGARSRSWSQHTF
ncbi:potassium channel subfamily K member 1-like isoform X2 [Pseudoliparis swirei]|uniref:potassium channel subfamily K member 1-like isoform X2 n=1 Tax=Pseudoliparis swirei TaxID=2059687 RepID=UPI0024BE293B|nr:potassium channel subfamily K member 1-like isoform X2 [Pseudoliparis swirei]